jgi:hypothetical protein
MSHAVLGGLYAAGVLSAQAETDTSGSCYRTWPQWLGRLAAP